MHSRRIPLIIVAGALATIASAQTAPRHGAALGLPQLDEQVSRKFTQESLVSEGTSGARNGEKHGAKFLALDATKGWSRPLRGGAKDLVFVSCSVYGSVGTAIEVGGARLLVADSEILAYGQLLVEENGKFRPLGIHVPMEFQEGKVLARFPVLTVLLDRGEGTWDLYHGAKLVAEDLPLATGRGADKFTLTAGEQGAWLNGLVQSDVNPLYPDSNGNGVDDTFEQQKRGRLLTSGDGKATRKELIAEWRKHQRTARPPALFVNLPRPD